MERFARIIEIPKTQCLLMVVYDDEEDAYRMNCTMVIEGVMATVGLGYEEEEQAYKVMNEFKQDDAQKMYDATISMVSAPNN